MKNIFDLSKKVVVVTGGAGLLGRAYVREFARYGATVYIAEYDLDRAEALKYTLSKEGLCVKTVFLDISDAHAIEVCVENIASSEKQINGWVNNAYPRTKDWHMKFEDIPVESWKENINSHLNGYCLCCQKVAEIMKKQRQGSIVNVASIYGIVGPDFSLYEGTTMTVPAAYAAIKGALVNFTRYLAAYYGPYQVRVNTLSPGGIFDNQPEIFVESYCKKTPLRRMGKPEDMIGAAVFLISDASNYMTGHNLIVDGGWSAI